MGRGRGRGLRWVVVALAALLAHAAGSAPAAAQPLLWRIEREPASYVFGTLHLPDARLLRLPPPVRRALDAAAVVHTEVPLDAASQAEAAAQALLPGSRTLKDELPPELWKDLEDYLTRRKVPPAALARLKIWAIGATLPLLPWLERMPQLEFLDQYLASQARARGARLGALESVASQVAALESLGREAQIELLRQTLDQLRDAQRRGGDPTEELLAVYLRGDLDALEAAAFGTLGLGPRRRDELIEALLYRRNEVMARGIRAALEREPKASQFFAVGALHLWGERSVLALLRAKGLRVERVATRPAGADGATP